MELYQYCQRKTIFIEIVLLRCIHIWIHTSRTTELGGLLRVAWTTKTRCMPLANKEALVVGGEIVTRTAKENGTRIIPADSEHNAVFQCLMGQPEDSLDSIILTASGGPFRDTPAEELAKVTPEEALRHPNW